jgi:hypothetical protein
MKYAMWLSLLVSLSACHTRASARVDAPDVAQLLPPDATESTLVVPRVVSTPSVVLFWLRGADTLSGDERADTFDDLRYYTSQVAPALEANDIRLLATKADTVFVALPHAQRRTILLSGLDYPYGYLLIDPGGPERILTGVYADDDLMDELRAYFDLPDDSSSAQPRITT